MARALFGHLSGAELRLTDEVRRLRTRVHDLEGEVLRLSVERDVLAAAVREHHVLPLADVAVGPDMAELAGVPTPAMR